MLGYDSISIILFRCLPFIHNDGTKNQICYLWKKIDPEEA